MKTYAHKRSAFLAYGLLLCLLAVPVVLTYRAWRQEKLNQALITAIKRHDASAVATLLTQGADANAPADRVTPTLWQYLKGGLRGKSSASTATPTALCVVFDWPQMWNEKQDDIVAERPADVRIVRALLAKGAIVKVTTADGWPLLMRPVNVGYEQCAQCLVDSGADVNASSPDGFTVLMAAAEQRNVSIVAMLLARGARLNTKYKGRTALHYAFLSRNASIPQILQQAGAKE